MNKRVTTTRNQRGTIAELAPALLIGLTVIFFIIGFGFFICGVATANFACQLAAREGSSGGSRERIRQGAMAAADRVAQGPLGAFVSLARDGGGNFKDSLKFRFFRIRDNVPEEVDFSTSEVDRGVVYLFRIDSDYQITIPFLGRVPGRAGAENIVDNPEALSIAN